MTLHQQKSADHDDRRRHADRQAGAATLKPPLPALRLPQQKGLCVGCDTGDVQIWTARGKTPAATVGGLRHGIAALAFHPSQPVVVAQAMKGKSPRGSERAETGALWYRAGPHYLGDRLIFSPDGTKVALVYDAHEGIHVYDMTSGATSDEVQGVCSPWHLFPGWNGLSVAEVTHDATIIRSPQTGGIIGRLPFLPWEFSAQS